MSTLRYPTADGRVVDMSTRRAVVIEPDSGPDTIPAPLPREPRSEREFAISTAPRIPRIQQRQRAPAERQAARFDAVTAGVWLWGLASVVVAGYVALLVWVIRS